MSELQSQLEQTAANRAVLQEVFDAAASRARTANYNLGTETLEAIAAAGESVTTAMRLEIDLAIQTDEAKAVELMDGLTDVIAGNREVLQKVFDKVTSTCRSVGFKNLGCEEMEALGVTGDAVTEATGLQNYVTTQTQAIQHKRMLAQSM